MSSSSLLLWNVAKIFFATDPVGLRPEWGAFVVSSTPRELALFGILEPGHPYWSEKTVSEFALRYPGLDVEQWRAALKRMTPG